jgi:hypothetical protein
MVHTWQQQKRKDGCGSVNERTFWRKISTKLDSLSYNESEYGKINFIFLSRSAKGEWQRKNCWLFAIEISQDGFLQLFKSYSKGCCDKLSGIFTLRTYWISSVDDLFAWRCTPRCREPLIPQSS